MSTPLMSVIITAFRQTPSVALLLQCLAVQDINHPFEVIICDDGSLPPLITACITELQPIKIDVRYVWQPKKGHRPAASKNNGIRIARGEYLVFLDGDILIKPDYLRLHHLAHTRDNLIVCNPRR